MKKSFDFVGSGKLILGKGKFYEVIKPENLTETALICGSSFLRTSQYELINKSTPFIFIVKEEPDPDLIDSITKEVKGNINSVIAVGGGSVLDTGKAVAAMCCSTGSVEDYLEGIGTKKPNGKTLPLTAVPTTAGTGSEATKNAVICRRGQSGYKKSLRHENYIPKVIIIDPQLYISCPAVITGFCGMDAFSQLLESYFSTEANIYTDMLAWKGLTIFIDYFMKLFISEKENLDDMGKIAFAAYLSGITLANAGLGTVHGIAGSMGGFCDIPHGAACGILLPEVTERIISKLNKKDHFPILEKIKKLDKYICENTKLCSNGKKGSPLLLLIKEWKIILNLPQLSAFGINKSDIDKIVAAATNKNSPVLLDKDEIKKIISICISEN